MLVAVRGGEGVAVGGMASGLGGVRGWGGKVCEDVRLMIKESGRLSGSLWMAVCCGHGRSGDLNRVHSGVVSEL
jgi:hypothetical protein